MVFTLRLVVGVTETWRWEQETPKQYVAELHAFDAKTLVATTENFRNFSRILSQICHRYRTKSVKTLALW
jgi:hypothetical protein